MSLTCQVIISLNRLPKENSDTIKKALEPDNVNFPEGLSMYVKNVDNKLVFNFESKKDMKQMIGTIDEILEHVQVVLRVIE